MNFARLAISLIAFAAGLPALSYADGTAAGTAAVAAPDAQAAAATPSPVAIASSKATPRLTVGVSDPNTQLNLPWFLNDAINAVNTRASASDFLHNVKQDL